MSDDERKTIAKLSKLKTWIGQNLETLFTWGFSVIGVVGVIYAVYLGLLGHESWELFSYIVDRLISFGLTLTGFLGRVYAKPFSNYLQKNYFLQQNIFNLQETKVEIYLSPEPTAHKFLLPPRPGLFIGREVALNWIKNHLYPAKHLTIIGTGGLGKTSVISEALHQLFEEKELQKRFPAGVIFHTFYQKPRLADAYATILKAVGQTPPAHLEEMERAVQLVLQGQPLLLVLDGAEEAVDLSTILKLSGQAGVLVSSQKRNDAGTIYHSLDKLPKSDAIKIIQSLGGKYATPLGAVEKLCKNVGNLPLALRLIGCYLHINQETAGEYLQWFKGTSLQRNNIISPLLKRSIEKLNQPVQELFFLFRYLANAPIPLRVLATALNTNEKDIRSRVSDLVNYSLWERDKGWVYPIHVLVYQWAKESESAKYISQIHLTRLMAYWACQGKKAEKAKIVTAFAPLQGLTSHWEQVIKLALAQKLYDDTYSFIEGVNWYLYLQIHSREHLRFRQHSVQISQHLSLKDQAYSLRRLGEIYGKCAEYRLAKKKYEKAQSIYVQIKDKLGEAHCIRSLGDIHLTATEYRLAQERYKKALLIYAQIKDDMGRLGEAHCIKGLGDVHLKVSEYKLAQERYEEARPIYIQIKDKLGEAQCIKGVADVYKAVAKYQLSREQYEEAKLIYAKLGARLGEANCILRLGDIHLKLAKHQLAQDLYKEARSIFVEIGNRLGEAHCIKALGDVYGALGEYGLAQERYKDAWLIYTYIEDKLGKADCIRSFGDVYLKTAQYELAREQYEEARLIYTQIGARRGEANCIRSLGDVYLKVAQYGLARERYEEARLIYAQIGARLGEANCIQSLGDVYGALEETPKAIELFQQALQIFDQLGLKNSKCFVWNSLGNLYYQQKNYIESIGAYNQALTIFPEAMVYRNRADAYIKQANYEAALADIEQAEQLQPGQPYAALHRGRVALWQKRPQEAVKYFQQAISLGPKVSIFHCWLSCGFLGQNLPNEAIEACQTALSLIYGLKEIQIYDEILDELKIQYGELAGEDRCRVLLAQKLEQLSKQ